MITEDMLDLNMDILEQGIFTLPRGPPAGETLGRCAEERISPKL